MSDKELRQEIERVVTRVLPLVPMDKVAEKSEFEVVLSEILRCLQGIGKSAASAQKTRKVLGDFAHEYGRLAEDTKSWEVAIGYLYAKYLKELGRL